MEEDYLRDIRALMLSSRAREIRGNLDIAESPHDLQLVTLLGEERQVLTFAAAMRHVISELEDAKRLIEEYSGY